jgi:hypothetical protein
MSKSKPIVVYPLISQELVERRIFLIRGKKVMLDYDLASLYQVTTKALNQAVKRNIKRFPSDFMFRLSEREKHELVTNCDRLKMLKHATYPPYAFTDLGIAMLSSVLNSERAILANLQIMRAFSRMKELISHHKNLQKQIDEMEKKYDAQFKVVFDAIREILGPKNRKSKKQIGFHVKY